MRSGTLVLSRLARRRTIVLVLHRLFLSQLHDGRPIIHSSDQEEKPAWTQSPINCFGIIIKERDDDHRVAKHGKIVRCAKQQGSTAIGRDQNYHEKENTDK